MNTANHKFLIDRAKERSEKSALAVAILSSSQDGRVIASELIPKLEGLGFKLEYKNLKVRTQCNITQEDKLVGSGLSDCEKDAFLHALLGMVRENKLV